MTRKRFVIWAPAFDDRSGGIVALHLLCKRLNEIGEEALIWDSQRPALRGRVTWKDWLRAVRYPFLRLRTPYVTGPFENPVARRSDLEGAIVVYPEIVEGDRLGAGRSVRWLLHRPGYHTGKAVFGADDLFFFYQEAFDDPAVNAAADNRLTLTWFMDEYRETNLGERSGSAYLLKKGRGRRLVHDAAGSILVDNLTHAERAAVFNRVERFYSYDLYSMFGLYAALCGCVPIVIPQEGLTKEQWTPDAQDRYGIAYGFDDIPWALATRGKLIERLRSVRDDQDAMLRRFVDKCRAAFEG